MNDKFGEDIGKGKLYRSHKKYIRLEGGKWSVNPDANPKSPDYYGDISLNIAGADGIPVRIRLSAWVRSGREGDSYLSLSARYDGDDERRLKVEGEVGERKSGPIYSDTPPPSTEDLPF